MSIINCQEDFDIWVKSYDRASCEHVIKKWLRQRLERGDKERPARIKFKFSLVKKLYNRQRGVCPRCKLEMALDRQKIHVDHFDPNAADFNAESNLRVLHSHCNMSKNANSVYDESKYLGKTVLESIEDQEAIHNEDEGL